MKLGNAAWGFRETAIEEQLRITKAMGLELLELSIAGYPSNELQLDSSNEEIGRIGKLFESSGISPECAATGNDFTVLDGKKCMDELEKVCRVIDIASELGVKFLRVFAGFSPLSEVSGQRLGIMIDCLQKAALHASRYGMALSIETHGGVKKMSDTECIHFQSISTSVEALENLMKEMPENVGINFDPANLYAVGIEKPWLIYEALKERVNYMHLKDFRKDPVTGFLTPVACGEGGMDWAGLMNSIKDFPGPALVEYENTADAEDGFRRSLDYLKKVL